MRIGSGLVYKAVFLSLPFQSFFTPFFVVTNCGWGLVFMGPRRGFLEHHRNTHKVFVAQYTVVNTKTVKLAAGMNVA